MVTVVIAAMTCAFTVKLLLRELEVQMQRPGRKVRLHTVR